MSHLDEKKRVRARKLKTQIEVMKPMDKNGSMIRVFVGKILQVVEVKLLLLFGCFYSSFFCLDFLGYGAKHNGCTLL